MAHDEAPVGIFRAKNFKLISDSSVVTGAWTNESGSLIIGGDVSDLDDSAKLQINSTGLGFLPPRQTTTQRDAISSPATGLIIYNTTTNKINVYTGSGWEAVTSA